jgi:hypothetical protein
LTLEERDILSKAITNEHLMSAFGKIFRIDQRDHEERMRQEALATTPNTNRMIQEATYANAALEWHETIRKRINTLVPR